MKPRYFVNVTAALAEALDHWDDFRTAEDSGDLDEMRDRIKEFIVQRFTLVEIIELALQSIRENQPEPKT